MQALILTLVLGAAPSAETVAADIDAITLYQNGAEVVRRGTVSLGRGRQVVRIDNLPGGLMRDTLRLAVRGATVVRVEARQVQRPQITVEEAEARLRTVEQLQAKRTLRQDEITAVRREENLLVGLSPSPGKFEQESKVRMPSTRTWGQVWDFVAARYNSARAKREELERSIAEIDEDLGRAMGELGELTQGAWTKTVYEVRATLDVPSSRSVAIDLRYMIHGTEWQPSYELHYDAKHRRTRLQMTGVVSQTTGENWSNAALKLATTHAVQTVALPRLLTWTLGEQRDFTPRPLAAGTRPAPQRYPVPAQLPPSWQRESQQRLQLLRQRLQQMQSGAGAAIGGLSAPRPKPTKSAQRQYARPSAPPPPPAEMDMDDEPMPVMEAPSAAQAMPGSVRSDRAPSRKRKPGQPATQMGLMSETPSPRRPTPLGGFAHVFDAPGRISLTSGAEKQRVPLAVFELTTKPFYESTPALEEKVFLTAEVENTGELPLLAGPVSVFSGKDFIVDATLPATGPRGTVKLPLGVDHDIEIKRRILTEKVSEGVISKSDITRYTVVIEAINRKSKALELRIHDQVPRARDENVEVGISDMKPTPSTGPGDDGLLSWDIELPPGKKKEVRIQYEVERPQHWEVLQ